MVAARFLCLVKAAPAAGLGSEFLCFAVIGSITLRIAKVELAVTFGRNDEQGCHTLQGRSRCHDVVATSFFQVLIPHSAVWLTSAVIDSC